MEESYLTEEPIIYDEGAEGKRTQLTQLDADTFRIEQYHPAKGVNQIVDLTREELSYLFRDTENFVEI